MKILYPSSVSEIKISVPPLAKLQSRWSEKWRAFDPEILPMPFAVMDYELAAPIKATLTSLIENSDAGYLGKIPELPEGLAHFAKARWGWDINPAQVKIAPDVGVGVIEIARLVTKPGDKILINTPVYYNFYNWITELHCTLVDAPLKENNLRYELDFAAIEASYATGVKVHILCNPHNPGGSVFTVDEIIHIKENSFHSIYRGVPRLKPALRTMILMKSMRAFQDNFFKNGAVPGLVLKSPNTLSEKIKERMMVSWQARYRPDAGGRRPLILDGGIEVDSISNVNFKELDFQTSIDDNEKIILKALGIPPIMLDSGNNANIRPNMRMYYLETILPIVRKINYGLERFFGFELSEDISDIPALQPELRDASAYYTSLVNGGIITAAEARDRLGFEPIEGTEEIRVPANIAGSAANPDEGGRPVEETEE